MNELMMGDPIPLEHFMAMAPPAPPSSLVAQNMPSTHLGLVIHDSFDDSQLLLNSQHPQSSSSQPTILTSSEVIKKGRFSVIESSLPNLSGTPDQKQPPTVSTDLEVSSTITSAAATAVSSTSNNDSSTLVLATKEDKKGRFEISAMSTPNTQPDESILTPSSSISHYDACHKSKKH
jgi:hypothetical protein